MQKKLPWAVAVCGLAVLGAARLSSRSEAPTAVPDVVLTRIAGPISGITAITNAGDSRLFVTLQSGQVVIWDGARILATPFLDVSSRISCCGERGLLSTAFHPSYASNGLFYVDYTDLDGNTVIARYRVSAGDPNVADPSSGVTLLTIDQPYANHNGGQLQFGPDGMLYVGMGDGGSANDPQCHAQRRDAQPGRDELLGKLLRLDVDPSIVNAPFYAIPAGNPFVAMGGPDEAWAIGLRNPWRFSFDRLTGDLVIGDVGQGDNEEIDFQPRASLGGENYGWKIMEGDECTNQTGSCAADVPPCFSPSFTSPVFDYVHANGRCSVTGGYVYRGSRVPDLYGLYLYGDYCSGDIWAEPLLGPLENSGLLTITASSLTTFGEDVNGEVYVGTGDGVLYRIDPSAPQAPSIASITPGVGYEGRALTLTVVGSHFAGGMSVLFGQMPAASVTFVSPTEIRVLTPALPPGTYDLTVTNPGAPPAVRPGGFVVVEIPRVPTPDRTPRVITR